MIALHYISSPLSLPALLSTAGRDCVRRFVVLLDFAGDVRRKDWLQPIGWATPANPAMRGSHGAIQNRGELRSSQGKAFVPGHGEILPPKKKCAMRKINLDTGYAMRMITGMQDIVNTIRFHLTNNTNGNGFYAAVQFAESIWTPQTSFKYVQEIRDGQPWWDCY
jgi:hypothetical protein